VSDSVAAKELQDIPYQHYYTNVLLDAFSLEVVDSLEKQDRGLYIIGLAVCNFRTKQAEYLKDKAIFGQEREVT
jgi:hypothetical protein